MKTTASGLRKHHPVRFPVGTAVLLLLASSCGNRIDSPSVLLVILDTVPTDHVGYCGYERNTTPVLDSLAATGSAFLQCQAQSPWTLPSCASIVSGLDVRSHGARRYSNEEVMGLGPDLPTIWRVLGQEGFATAGFTNSYIVGPEFGWHQGFDTFYCNELGHHNAGATIDMSLDWLDGLEGEPFFLLVHLFEPHSPYDPPPPFDTMFGDGGEPFDWNESDTYSVPDSAMIRHLTDLYDGGLAEADQQLGRLLSELRSRGLDRNTIVIVVADHGEEFMEHGFVWHGKTLFQEVLQVPLVISGPGIPRGVVDRPVAQVDIVPTLMTCLGLDWPGRLDGRDLFGPETGDVPIFSTNLNATTLDVICVRIGDTKTIWEATCNSALTFDLTADPGEFVSLPPDSLGLELVRTEWASPCECTPVRVDRDRVDEMLRDLGYI